jgi:hypothetical protein
MTPAISVRFATNADTTWLSAMFHPGSRNDQGDYRRQADMMSAQRLVCFRHDAAILVCDRLDVFFFETHQEYSN